jgi:ABC-type polysaccharide/polyol phosphate transport system ATPase subunit/ABC-type polysaccharide/polyol phosphate export permease
VSVQDLHKGFDIPQRQRTSLKEGLAERFRPIESERFEALRGVSFDVARGEFFGIVGRNGSGKSSLLKVTAGIYGADSGRVEVTGRLSPFIEMGVGFRPELSARDNVYLNGAILGLSRREIGVRLHEIFAFAELEDFADLKLKNFSSGMTVRLAFSMAIQVEADVVLVDEVLAVGDAAFQRKCYAQFDRLRSEGRTVLFVTHDMEALKRHCDRVLLLEEGRAVAMGAPGEIARRYEELNERSVEAKAREDGAARADLAPSRQSEQPAFATAGKPAVYRPSALGGSLPRFLSLTRTLARADLQQHYEDSVLGYLWSILRPLSLFAVLYLVFGKAADLGRGVSDYPVYLLCAIVMWTFFTETTSGGVMSLVANSALLRRMRFPRLVIPASVMAKGALNLLLNFVAVAIAVALAQVEPRWTWLELPLLMLALGLLASGFAMILSALYVRLRDTQQLWTVAQQLLFFGSPIIYVASRYPESVQDIFNLSPLTAIFTQMRHALLDPSAPTAVETAGGPLMMLVPVGITLGLVGAGLWFFTREAPKIAERL